MKSALTNGQAWAGSITAAVFAEYIKPSVDYFLLIGSMKLANLTGVAVPQNMVDGLSAITVIAVVYPVIHILRQKGVINGQSDPTTTAGA
jgi:hypothetical protein